MVVPCVVQFCNNIGNHRFPKDETRRSRWMEAIEQVKPGNRKNSFICSTHFTPADFFSTSTDLAKAPRAHRLKILKRNAVPSIFPWNKACQQPNHTQHQQQSEPIFNPTTVHSTYSRTPPVAFVEILPMLESDVKVDEIIDPLDIPINSDVLRHYSSNNLSKPRNRNKQC